MKAWIFRIIFVCCCCCCCQAPRIDVIYIFTYITKFKEYFFDYISCYSLSLSVPSCVHPRTFQGHNWRYSFELFWEHEAFRWRASRGSENLWKYSASQVWVIRRWFLKWYRNMYSFKSLNFKKFQREFKPPSSSPGKMFIGSTLNLHLL